MRLQILNQQKSILARIKREVRLLEGPPPPSIRKYQKAYEKEFGRLHGFLNKKTLLKRLSQSQIVLSGDFHSFGQSQRLHLRLLRDLVERKQIVVALEMLSEEHVPLVQKYLEGKMTSAQLKKSIQFDQSWGFDWDSYLPLFEFCKETRLPVRGVRADSDKKIASKIFELTKENPDHLIFVVYGELHLSRPFVPAALRKILLKNKMKRELSVVFQNAEKVYWQLVDKGLEEKVDCVNLGGGRYCVINAPPWAVWQSHLTHLETTSEAHFEDGDGLELTDHFRDMVQLLAKLWSIPAPPENFNIFGPGDLKILRGLTKVFGKRHLAFYEQMISEGQSFYIPENQSIYLARMELNPLAHLAGQFLYFQNCRRTSSFSLSPEDFLCRIWTEGVGFFASLLVNHRRKSDTIKDVKEMTVRRDRHRIVALLVLEQRLREKIAQTQGLYEQPKSQGVRGPWHYSKAARILGALLGLKMYLALKSGVLKKTELKSWLSQRPERGTNFEKFYFDSLRKLNVVKEHYASKHERL